MKKQEFIDYVNNHDFKNHDELISSFVKEYGDNILHTVFFQLYSC